MKRIGVCLTALMLSFARPAVAGTIEQQAQPVGPVVIHEIAWMGTETAPEQQWVELFNASDDTVDMTGWHLRDAADALKVVLTGKLPPGDSFLLLHADYPALPGMPADQLFTGRLCEEGQTLVLRDAKGNLIDQVDRWYAGDATTHATMQRVYPYLPGTAPDRWDTARIRYDVGYGSPGYRDTTRHTGQHLHRIVHAPGAINVYFNQPALTRAAWPGNEANHTVNLEQRFLDRIRRARTSIDITLYELNLPNLTDLLVRKAAEGVRLRVLVDSKIPHPEDLERVERWDTARMHLERLVRGMDGIPGSADSAVLFANAPIFAFDQCAERRMAMGLPATPDDLPQIHLTAGAQDVRGALLVRGERREEGWYYRPGAQMHNKFIIIDDQWVWTSSMNFTITDLYGSEENAAAEVLEGNTNNGIAIHSPELAAMYRAEFERMWGGDGPQPVPEEARFSGRKPTREAPHRVSVGDCVIEVYFSPGYNVIPAITQRVRDYARERVYFAIFAWSDHQLEQALKVQWEGATGDQEGELTGFDVRGVLEFWDEWWSVAINMTGRKASQDSVTNPNIRWKHPPPVFRQNEARRLHHKYMLIDPETEHQAIVITGSANWSNNANTINDENSLFLYCNRIANQYVQDFLAIYERAGGDPSW